MAKRPRPATTSPASPTPRQIRSRSTADEVLAGVDIRGKVFAVTGAAAGGNPAAHSFSLLLEPRSPEHAMTPNAAKPALFALTLLQTLLAPAALGASCPGNYTYTVIADTADEWSSFEHAPAIAAGGHVVFVGQLDDGGAGLFDGTGFQPAFPRALDNVADPQSDVVEAADLVVLLDARVDALVHWLQHSRQAVQSVAAAVADSAAAVYRGKTFGTGKQFLPQLTRLMSLKLREHQRDIAILARDRDQDPHRSIERRGDEPRHLGLVGKLEGGIDVGLERELAQQREAERVDGADGDVAESIAQLEPACAIELGQIGGAAELAQDALPHLRGRLARKGNGQDVGRVDAGLQQVDIAGDQDRRLPGARRGFQHDVVTGIDGVRARLCV